MEWVRKGLTPERVSVGLPPHVAFLLETGSQVDEECGDANYRLQRRREMDSHIFSIPLPQREVVPVDEQSDEPELLDQDLAFLAPAKVLFLNGFGARPGGINPTILRAHGHMVVEPNLPDGNFARSVTIAQRVFNRHQPDVVIGWSRGGAVAMSLDCGDVPLILIAPAWKSWGTMTTVKSDVTILHSPKDELVPIGDSRELLANSGLPQQRLLAVGEDHRMIDEAAFVTLLEAVEQYGASGEKRQAA